MKPLTLITAYSLIVLFQQIGIGQVENKTSSPKSNLVGTVDKVSGVGTSNLTFNFGSVSLLDLGKLTLKFYADREEGIPRVGPFEHHFKLKNTGEKPVLVEDFYTDSPISGEFLKDSELIQCPITIEPGEEIGLLTALSIDSLTPGPVLASLILRDSGRKEIARVSMKGVVENGLSIIPRKLNLNLIPFGQKKSEILRISMHKDVPGLMPPGGVVRFVSSNPYVRVESLSSVGVNEGFLFEKDVWRFKNPNIRCFKQDANLRLKLTLADNAPLGKFKARIDMLTPGFPLWMMVSGVGSDVYGEVVGHMRVVKSPQIIFGPIPVKKPVTQTLDIVCTAPVTPKNLKVLSRSKFVAVKLVPAKAGDGTVISDRARLEVTQTAESPVGQRNGTITVTNTVNKERLELETYATIKR